MIYLFRIFTFLLVVSSFAQANDPEEEILDFLPRVGYVNVSKKDIQKLNKAGSNTASVYSILIKKGNEEAKETLICKELRGLKNEQKNLEILVPFISDYEVFRETQPFQFPPQYVAFARYRGASQDFVLFDEASGESVFNLMREWAQKGYRWEGLDPLDTRDHLIYAFRNVGRAIAAFHLKYGAFQKETNTFYSILHGDLHISNIFYNIWSNKTTFIDYETMAASFQIKGNVFMDINRLFDFSKQETAVYVREKAGEVFCKSHNIYFLDEKILQQREYYIDERLKILDEFFNAMKEGYAQAFATAGYLCDIDHQKITKN